ncbi:MAG TPA: response regulator, partial [Desulfatiglandales bacterium]|nr:response regulator [Desulfatiglandales bacterium]
RHTIAEEYRRDFTILLVEDYPTNQQVAMRNLRSASYHVDLAENGMQAVKAFKQKHYDLILMDIQMPVMDGYNAAKEIRDLEGKYKKDSNRKIFEGSKRVPIIAMTAHVMKGDREKCLDAGMDDYISKPLRKKALLSMIEKWVTSKQESEKACELGLSESAEGDTPMNFQIALEEFEGDRDFLKEVLGGFIMNARSQARIINQAILDGNAGVIREEAHAIKGGAANLCADRLSGIALELENIGKSDVLKGGMDLLERLDKELNRLEIYVMSRYPEPIAPID